MMQRVFSMVLVACVLLVTAQAPTRAQDSQTTGEADRSARWGDNIHNATVDHHQFAYYLIEMEGMKATHHMMVYVTTPDGKLLDKAKVGYFVVGPDGAKQKVMGMDMQGGFGADLNFGAKGTYAVKTKAVAEGTTLRDQFTYEVK